MSFHCHVGFVFLFWGPRALVHIHTLISRQSLIILHVSIIMDIRKDKSGQRTKQMHSQWLNSGGKMPSCNRDSKHNDDYIHGKLTLRPFSIRYFYRWHVIFCVSISSYTLFIRNAQWKLAKLGFVVVKWLTFYDSLLLMFFWIHFFRLLFLNQNFSYQ